MERAVLPQGANRTIRVYGLRRVAVGNPKVAKARAVPPDQILLTAKSKGRTIIRTWSDDGSERTFGIEVVSSYATAAESNPGLVKVALDLLEIDGTERADTGVRWPDTLPLSSQVLTQGTGAGVGTSYTLMGGGRGWIQQMVKSGRAKVLASPELYVRTGEQATFSSGGEIPVPSTSENFGRSQKHVEWKPFGMDVKVRPESSDAYQIFSDIYVELSELNPARAIDGVPSISRRKLVTKVNSLDGETVVLSGLVRQLRSQNDEGIPVLKDIPILGGLFSSRTRSDELHELAMAVTLSFPTRSQIAESWETFESKFEKAAFP